MMQAMNRTYFRMVSALVAAFLFAACTQDELTNSTDTLPEGMYPLQISGITLEAESSQQPWGADAPQTRVSETDDRNGSVWQNGDKINVQIGDGTPGVYTYTDGKLEVADGDAPAYWASTDNGQTITAWYTSSGSETVDLSKQINGLAYVLTASVMANFNTNVSLTFSHALAKVRVVPEGEKKDEVTDVRIKTYTGCTLSADGKLSANGKEEYIPMVKTTHEGKTYWEANVVPSHPIADILLNSDTPCNLSNTVNPQKEKVHEITITVNKKIPVLQGGETIIGPGDYIMRGNITSGVTLQGDGINLTLDNVTADTDTPIKISGGTSTIILQGNNTLTASAAPAIWLMGENANVIIKGTENSHLKVSSTDGSAAIGTNYYDGSIETWTLPCGNITIENASIEASSQFAAAAIGTGVGYQAPGTCGVIIIIKSDIKATAVEYLQRGKPAVIGTGGTDGQPMSCKGINITLKDGQSKDAFLSKLTGPYTKVGAGEGLNNASNTCGPINWYNSDGSSAN